MNSNKIAVIINKPVEVVFEFTTNPKNTRLWIPSIKEEVAEEYPPKIGTQYKNRRQRSDWNFYRVVEFKRNRLFTLTDLDNNYHVRYSYKELLSGKTELEYSEWMEEGALKNPLAINILHNLKFVLEKNQ